MRRGEERIMSSKYENYYDAGIIRSRVKGEIL